MNTYKMTRISCTIAFVSLMLASCIKENENTANGTAGDVMTVYALRQLYTGNERTLDAGALGGATKIEGVVISDKDGKNIDNNSFVLQHTLPSSNAFTDVTRGIIVNMSEATTYNNGDSLQITITGAKLNRLKGNLTLSGIAADKIKVIATGRTPLSRAVSQGRLHTVMDQYESTLVTLHADVVDYTAGATLSGTKTLNDQTGAPVYLYTLSGATHAANALPVNAQFGGIASYVNDGGNDTSGARKVIMPRNATDIQFASGALYANFPESFESPDAATKSSYNSGTNIVALKTGNWYLLQAILGNTPGSDRYNEPGKQGIRMQQNLTTSGFVQMNFDVTAGASKVTVFYGRYGTDARSSIRLESSIDGGTTWVIVGTPVSVNADKEFRQATWMVNFSGNVRFRINKLGTGTSNNGRLSLDDFAIYRK